MKTVMLLFGGQSSEHEVSCMSVKNVIENIDRREFNVISVGITKNGEWLVFEGDTSSLADGKWQQHTKGGSVVLDVVSPRKLILALAAQAGYDRVDLIHPVLHGINSEDGVMQGFLELCGIPYVGAGVLGSAMAMDKEISKIIFERENIPIGKYFCITRDMIESCPDVIRSKVDDMIGYPCFVKPANAGSSVGVGKVKNKAELIDVLKESGKYDRKIIIEQFIDGRELECAVLGNEDPKISGVGEVVPCNEFYDYKAKYFDDRSENIIPADIPAAISERIRDYSRRAFIALNCDGLSRVDFMLEKTTGELLINEINTLPGFTDISMYSMLWNEQGLSNTALITALYRYAERRFIDTRRSLKPE